MSTPDESPAQRAARQRRERREAKIREGGSARLDKITSLSGRTPQSSSSHAAQEEDSPSPRPSQPTSPAISQSPSPSLQAQQDQQSVAALQAQQDAFRAMLRQAAPEVAQHQQSQEANEVEDPTLKLLNSLLGSMPTDPNGPPPPPDGAPGQAPSAGPGLGPAAIASALGLPPFLANLVGGALQTQEENPKSVRLWKTLHIFFALSVAFYLLFIIGSSVALFGSLPPKPATAQNPFVIFMTGELLLCGTRVLFGGQNGIRSGIKLVKDVIRDGSLIIFALGLGSWYTREWQVLG
ncbi:hypothetical protein N7478_010364 [Penicillium angulare]|uniref:uncharacterized protein n=1 Tax=Penicillium angulare TaxID=116970 RepID=UPI0025412B42|nr:uncharacterized protein N7478_010364 [Penicillium angulare]KAJ5267556.1 hypothetical protein N7478_010364 [Penicillium angulare]